MFFIEANLTLRPLIGYGFTESPDALLRVSPDQRRSIKNNLLIQMRLIDKLRTCITSANLSQSHQTWSITKLAYGILPYINNPNEAGYHTSYIIEDDQRLPLGIVNFTERNLNEGKTEFLELALIDYNDLPQILDLCLKHYQNFHTYFHNKRVTISLHPSLISEYFENAKWSVVSDVPDLLTQVWIQHKTLKFFQCNKDLVGENSPPSHAFERIQLDHMISV